MSNIKTTTKALRYLRAKTLPNKWQLLNKSERRYVRHLVEDYGWSVDMAIQHGYIFGYQTYTYDYRRNMPIEETMPRKVYWH